MATVFVAYQLHSFALLRDYVCVCCVNLVLQTWIRGSAMSAEYAYQGGRELVNEYIS